MEEVKEYVKQCRCLTSHNQELYAILWGQSTESIHAKVEACPGFNQIRMDSDGIHLLNEILIIMLNVQEQQYLLLTIHQTKYNFFICPKENSHWNNIANGLTCFSMFWNKPNNIME